MKDQAKVIAALLVGAAAGAALGLLLAPEKGEDLRGDIADYVNDLIASAKEKAQNTANTAKDYANTAKEYGSDVVDSVKSKFNSAVGDAEDAVDSAKSRARDYAENGYGDAKSKVKSTANDWNNSIQNS